MSIEFRPAKMDRTPLMIGLAGPSGSGKTYTALRIAKGITSVSGGKIFMIDTEAKRGLHYAKFFDYAHGELKAPFRPDAYLAAMEAAVKAGAAVLIIDSMSHEHEGQGGILEWQEEELNRMAGQDYEKRDKMKFAAWIKPKAGHNKFVNFILQNQIDVIFCFRAKDKIELKKIDGKVKPIAVGWQPICADRLEYEMTTLLVFPPQAKGVPDYSAKATKVQNQHKPIFKEGAQLDEKVGVALKNWAMGIETGGVIQAPTGEGAANQGDLKSDPAGGGSDNAKVPDPLYTWVGSDGTVKEFPAKTLYTAVILGISKSKDADQLEKTLVQNGQVLIALKEAGHSDMVDDITHRAQSKCMTLRGIMPPV